MGKTKKLSTKATEEEIANGIKDEFGVVYSKDGKRLLECKNKVLESYEIREGTKVICDYAFWCCESLNQVTFPNSVSLIGNFTFYRCFNLQEVYIPNSITSIGDNAFIDCKSIKVLTFSNSVTNIGKNAFTRCVSLQQVTFPTSLVSIGESAFSCCFSLRQIDFFDSVTEIGNAAFRLCDSLQRIIIPEKSIDKFIQILPVSMLDKVYYMKKAITEEQIAEKRKDLPF